MAINLIEKIICTDFYNLSYILEKKGHVYTFLNPVSYLDALDNKDLFGEFDGVLQMVRYWWLLSNYSMGKV